MPLTSNATPLFESGSASLASPSHQNRMYELRTPPRSLQRRQIDLQQLQAGQKVVKKYRKYARNAEFRRLKAIVPSLSAKNDVSKVSLSNSVK